MKVLVAASYVLAFILPRQGLANGNVVFNRISFFPVCKQLDPMCRTDNVTNSEIVAASEDGMTLVYGDSQSGVVGFVDIRDPYHPTALGTIDVGGEPTSVSVVKNHAVVAVNTRSDYVNVSGLLHLIDIPSQTVKRTLDLEGQPDCVAVSPDHRFAAIAIENERNEDLGDGGLPQLPGGFLNVLSTEAEDIMDWTLSRIELSNLPGMVEGEDPEPEFISISTDNVAVITLQENNGIVLVDLETMEVTASFSAGNVTLTNLDVIEDSVIFQNSSVELKEFPREPDGVTWIGTDFFATADEGDWNGGTRGFTIYDTSGAVIYTSAEEMDSIAIRYGHYPEDRSEAKGNEPENIEYGVYGENQFLFVNSERASLIFVYDVKDPASPLFLQALPAGLRPEGSKAIPGRNLLVVASEEDSRGDKFRAGISIYAAEEASAKYPTIISEDDETGNPIPFSALSGLAAAEPYGTRRRGKSRRNLRESAQQKKLSRKLEDFSTMVEGDSADLGQVEESTDILYSIEDSYFKRNRIFTIDAASYPAKITNAVHIMDSSGVLASALQGEMRSKIVNSDNTVNLDPEGIAVSQMGGFWIVSEGAGTVGDETRPVESFNMLLKLDDAAVIEKVIFLPDELNEIQVRFGFEGVAEDSDGQHIVVVFQRAWGDEADPRIGIYDAVAENWSKFVFYPLGQPESQNGGWVGLSDIAPLGNGKFMVVERDDQSGLDAQIKRLFVIDLGDFSLEDGVTIEKEFYMDLLPVLSSFGGAVIEKVEGLAVSRDGTIYINTDNDGVDDNSGEQIFARVGQYHT